MIARNQTYVYTVVYYRYVDCDSRQLSQDSFHRSRAFVDHRRKHRDWQRYSHRGAARRGDGLRKRPENRTVRCGLLESGV